MEVIHVHVLVHPNIHEAESTIAHFPKYSNPSQETSSCQIFWKALKWRFQITLKQASVNSSVHMLVIITLSLAVK